MNNTTSGLSKTKNKRSQRGRLPDGAPNPVDVHAGNRLRIRRKLLGISQEALAKMIGLTFQQVQKYERGMNRICVSRLWDIAQVLHVPISFFFEEMTPEIAEQSPRNFMLAESLLSTEEEIIFNEADPMNRAETIELVGDYYRIHNRALAKSFKHIIHEAARTNYAATEDALEV